MSGIQIRDKQFELFIPEESILKEVKKIAEQIKQDLWDKNPLFICILNGAFMFASDLIKQIEFPCEVTFIRLKSYQGVRSEGQIKEVDGLIEEIKDRHVVVVEDIIDTGHTVYYLLNKLKKEQPASLRVATLLLKPDALSQDVTPDYVALRIPSDFIVGYGLDYDGHGRNLRDIYKIKA